MFWVFGLFTGQLVNELFLRFVLLFGNVAFGVHFQHSSLNCIRRSRSARSSSVRAAIWWRWERLVGVVAEVWLQEMGKEYEVQLNQGLCAEDARRWGKDAEDEVERSGRGSR